MEHHIRQHDFHSDIDHGQCRVCKDILEHCSEDDDTDLDGGYSSSISTVSSSTCFPRSSLSTSDAFKFKKYKSLKDLGRKSEPKAGIFRSLGGSVRKQEPIKTRARRRTNCEHVLRKKHKYCTVCYQCSLCQEVFLRKNYSSSEDSSDSNWTTSTSPVNDSDSRHCGHFDLSLSENENIMSCIVEWILNV